MLIELQHAFVKGLPSKMLGHQVGWALCAENLAELELLCTLYLLDPKAADVDVPEFAGTFALGGG